METSILTLLGIANTLEYIVRTQMPDDAPRAETLTRLTQLRSELLEQAVSYSKTVGAARDSLFGTIESLQGVFSTQREWQWILHQLDVANVEDVQPPPLPSSSVIGPHSVGGGTGGVKQWPG